MRRLHSNEQLPINFANPRKRLNAVFETLLLRKFPKGSAPMVFDYRFLAIDLDWYGRMGG